MTEAGNGATDYDDAFGTGVDDEATYADPHSGNVGAMQAPMLPTHRSARTWKPTERFLEGAQQESIALPTCLEAAHYDPYSACATDGAHAFALLAHADKDTIYILIKP